MDAANTCPLCGSPASADLPVCESERCRYTYEEDPHAHSVVNALATGLSPLEVALKLPDFESLDTLEEITGYKAPGARLMPR